MYFQLFDTYGTPYIAGIGVETFKGLFHIGMSEERLVVINKAKIDIQNYLTTLRNKVSIMNLNCIYELEHEGHNTIFSKRMRLGIHIRMNYKKG